LHTRALRATGAPVDAITAELSRLDDFLAALLVLSDVSAPPALEEFELSAEIQGLTEEEAGRADYPVSLAGPNPCVVVGDRRILGLIYRNGLRNAIEASLGVNEHPPIVVNWGDSDVDYWLSIADAGTGLPVDLAQMFVVGKTTKRDHLGMGLSIAQHAAEAVNGSINLTPRTVGALFELRWPRRAT
jgi:C4-dicarboxylate-specific signal transduction histidine kinase